MNNEASDAFLSTTFNFSSNVELWLKDLLLIIYVTKTRTCVIQITLVRRPSVRWKHSFETKLLGYDPKHFLIKAGVSKMRKFRVSALTFMVAGFGFSTVAQARDVVLEYRLPKTIVGFAASHMITKCPDAKGNRFEMEVTTSATEVHRAGETISVNAAGSVFVDRQIKIDYFPNGTIKSFNGTSDGQGEELLVAGIRAISFAASASVSANVLATATANPQPILAVTCQDWVKKALEKKQETQDYLRNLRQASYTTGVPQNVVSQIEEASALIAALDASLTLQSEPRYWTPSFQATPAVHNLLEQTSNCSDLKYSTCSIEATGEIVAGDISSWFNPSEEGALANMLNREGYGQLLVFSLSGKIDIKRAANRSNEADRKDDEKVYKELVGALTNGLPVRSLVYRSPVRASVTIKPKIGFPEPDTFSGASLALARVRYDSTTKELRPLVPQVGPLVEVPFSGSSIFGSRAVSADFSEAGDLTQIGYTNKGGASAIASVINATTDAVSEQRDARVNAYNRKIKILTAEDDLRDRIKAKAPAE